MTWLSAQCPRMRIFFDTEFTQFRHGELLSIGFVSEDDQELVIEVHDHARHARASDFCRNVVIPQFGAVKAMAVATDREVGTAIADWLSTFSSPVTLCYDYKLDWHFLENALRCAGVWSRVSSGLSSFNVADVANHDACLQAQEDYFLGRASPGRHHPLVDALALRARWREHLRLQQASKAG
jgi:hypothetical protein